MKKYGRWLFFDGVDHLPGDKKKVYAFEKIKEEERKRRDASNSKKKSLMPNDSDVHRKSNLSTHLRQFTGPIEELNENSRDDNDNLKLI
jgi:hypothetical protein